MDAKQLESLCNKLKSEKKELERKNKYLEDYIKNTSDNQAKNESDDTNNENASHCIVILGASGDLAKNKTYPALFHLFRFGMIPENTLIFGYARSKMTRDEFNERIHKTLIDSKEEEEQVNKFLKQSHYYSGQYDSEEDLSKCSDYIRTFEQKISETTNNRIFYMALPPSIFIAALTAMKSSIMSDNGFSRVIVEKPFGKDLNTFQELNYNLGSLFKEKDLYRIDHYLGKEMVQNLMALRFANIMFEPIWNRHFISNVKITFKEDFGIKGRAGYFDEFGIIRDVVQNHLIQILALMAMECPISLTEEDIRDEKVKVLRAIEPVTLEDTVIGQYGENPEKGLKGYLEEENIPKDSVTPTFVSTVMKVNNDRWSGVPFIVKCGKHLEKKTAEIRIQFKKTSHPLFKDVPPNEFVYIIQPNEAIYFKTMTKVPGLSNDLVQTELDLSYNLRFTTVYIADAYERLLLDVFRGDRSLFVRADELEASWKIFTPILEKLEKERIKPIIYKAQTRGPIEADELSEKHGWRWYGGYDWPKTDPTAKDEKTTKPDS